MPAKRKPIVLYPNEQDEIRWQRLREHYQATSNTDGDIARELIREKCIAILGGDTGRARTARIESDVMEVQEHLIVLEKILQEVLNLLKEKNYAVPAHRPPE